MKWRERMERTERFRKGLEFFNQGEFFECHEVIEELWLETPPADEYRDLYKGVIQAAAALYQFERGISSGARGLIKTSLTYLEKYRPEALGLNVKGLADQMKACLEEWERPAPRLKQNWIPKVEYH